MNREQKAAAIDEVAERLGEAEAIFAVDYRGISVPGAAELRVKLAEADASFKVVKNRLAKLAAERAGTAELVDLLEGPTALTLIKGDPVTAAKTISDFSRDHGVLVFKGGLMDGAPLAPEQFQAIAKLPGLDVLHGQLVGVTASPLTGVVRGLAALLGGLASQLGQIQDQGLVTGEAPAAAEEPAAEEPAAEEPAAEEPEEETTGTEDEASAQAEEEPPAASEEEPPAAPEEEPPAAPEEEPAGASGEAAEDADEPAATPEPEPADTGREAEDVGGEISDETKED
jgi:large subunit ribosomal protein L10